MARAKRTERTDARRRSRAEQAAQAGTAGDEGASTAATSETAQGQPAARSQAKTGQPAQPQRPGFTTLMKSAYRPPHIVDDLKSLPQVLMNPGLLIAVAGSVGIAIWFCLSYNTAISQVPPGDQAGVTAVTASYQIPAVMMGMVISPPPAVGAFLIGFMAKRASWLGGLIYGIICTIIVVLVLQQPAGRIFLSDTITPESVIAQTAAWSPMGAALFAAAAAWYKRFLNLSNPNRARAEAEKNKKNAPKQPTGRGNVKTNYRSGGTR